MSQEWQSPFDECILFINRQEFETFCGGSLAHRTTVTRITVLPTQNHLHPRSGSVTYCSGGEPLHNSTGSPVFLTSVTGVVRGSCDKIPVVTIGRGCSPVHNLCRDTSPKTYGRTEMVASVHRDPRRRKGRHFTLLVGHRDRSSTGVGTGIPT